MSTYQAPSNERDALLAALQEQTDLLNAHPEEADIISKVMDDLEVQLAALGEEEAQDDQAALSPIFEMFTSPQLQTDGFSCPSSPVGEAGDSDADTDMDYRDSDEDELNDHLRERFCSHECDHESCRVANEHWYGCKSQLQDDCDCKNASDRY
ncbi:hypothetical protein Asppvi_006785 [Aspergillus pseudoviridinutans]|uniref:Uncharacterized protein n=1 Tax=Aspergillus pseudoviridinutans TaxID=1517512 RepID=A0A9P3BAM7_9EURO|nr:uncharacterized protein Asppvi_006785 [Aspergillus pseudoviridinutans]GIJ87872.1 hypothetical protein Asppvi_006785 [Aspergillus pseudoviridinutans]